MLQTIGERQNESIARPLLVAGTILVLLTMVQMMGCAGSSETERNQTASSNIELEDKWGVRVESIRLTAAGHLVDFRYRVIDPEKAAILMKRGTATYLLDETTGTKLPVPVTKVGQLRGTGTLPQANRVYTVMFNSGGGLIQQGSVVTVVIGDFKAEHLTVQ